MKDVPQLEGYRGSTDYKGLHATPEDFERFFANETTDLLRLSLHLTADTENAESCLALAMRDCLSKSSVSKDQVRAWARRMVMQNAIRLLWGIQSDIPDESGLEFHLQPRDFPLEALRECVEILALPDFDRVALVICVLERYSVLDCALLLRKSPQEVYDAIARAKSQVLPAVERTHPDTTTFAGNMYGAIWGQANRLDFWSILD